MKQSTFIAIADAKLIGYRLVVSRLRQQIWMILVIILSYSVSGISQNFITEWTFTDASSKISFNALTEGAVDYTWVANPSGNSGSGSFEKSTEGEVMLSGLNILVNMMFIII